MPACVCVSVYVLYRFLNRMTVDAFQMWFRLPQMKAKKMPLHFMLHVTSFISCVSSMNVCMCVCLFWLVSSNTLMMVVFGSMGFSAVPLIIDDAMTPFPVNAHSHRSIHTPALCSKKFLVLTIKHSYPHHPNL